MKTCKLIQWFFTFAGILTVGALSVRGDILTGPMTNAANGHLYFLLTYTNWTDSQRQAVELGGNLATVRNLGEEQWIYTNLNNYAGLVRNLWIGLYDPDPVNNSANRVTRRSEFRWISGEPVTFSHWSGAEPNNPDSTEGFIPPEWEPYVHIWNKDDSNAGRWNNFRDAPKVLNDIINGVVEVIPWQLSIAPVGQNQAALSWPVWGSNYVLETSTDLSPGVVWQQVTNMPVVSGGYLKVTHTLQESRRFFRLR